MSASYKLPSLKIRSPRVPKVSGIAKLKPGGRNTTSMAQRNASRRNIRRAQIGKQARRPV